MRITIILSSLALMSGIFLTSCNQANALTVDQIDNYSGFSIIHPAHPLYFLKSIRESIEMKISTNPKTRFIRKIEFATRRVREVKSLINDNREDLIAPTLEKYGAILAEITGMDTSQTDQVNMAQDEIGNHLLILIKYYPKLEDKRAKIAFRSTINKINEWNSTLAESLIKGGYSDSAKKSIVLNTPACEFLGQVVSSSALNEVERVVLSERAKKCFANLE